MLKLSHEKPEEEIANIPPSVCPEIDRNVETERSEKENSSGSLPGHILPTKNGGNVQASSTTTSAHDSNSDDSDANESDSNANKFDSDVYFKSDDSDANKSDSDVYFKSDDSDSDDEYDHEFHERLMREEMARLAKLEDKTLTKPAYEEDDFDKMLSEAIEEELAYFDDPAPQSVTVTA
ncbi:unnamed protein product [Rhizophagus irregularis]|nr:unnamed protein product [Rhizophagus irregularis]